jgi:hypothetical protein
MAKGAGNAGRRSIGRDGRRMVYATDIASANKGNDNSATILIDPRNRMIDVHAMGGYIHADIANQIAPNYLSELNLSERELAEALSTYSSGWWLLDNMETAGFVRMRAYSDRTLGERGVQLVSIYGFKEGRVIGAAKTLAKRGAFLPDARIDISWGSGKGNGQPGAEEFTLEELL